MPEPRRHPVNLRRLLIGLAIGLGVSVVGVLVAAEVFDRVNGRGSVDPTDSSNYSTVQIVNDLQVTEVVADCEGSYCERRMPRRLDPGETLTGHAACGVTGAEMTSWRITDTAGNTVGFVAVNSPRSDQRPVYHLSHVSPSRQDPTIASQ